MNETATQNQDGSDQKHCVRCRELIHPEAKSCPHCWSAQQRSRLKLLADGLKWIGGIAAVVSLLIGIYRVNKLLVTWQQTRRVVSELAAATELRREIKDFEGAWNLIRQALELDPASEQARRIEVTLAMDWVRNLSSTRRKENKAIVDLLLPSLYRGMASKNKSYAADVMAHIAWADRFRGQADIDFQLEKALSLDADNLYANTMLGYRKLVNLSRRPNLTQKEIAAKIDDIMPYFAAALKTDGDRHFVREYQFRGLVSLRHIGERKVLQLANALRQKDEDIGMAARHRILSIYRTFWFEGSSYEDKIANYLASLPADDLLHTYLWVNEGIDYKKRINVAVYYDIFTYTYIEARLRENTGDYQKSAALYKKLYDALNKKNIPSGQVRDREKYQKAYERVSKKI